jgi:hypothetical protein
MSTPKVTSSIADPTLRVLLDTWQNSTLLRLNCHRLGTIVSFDPASQTASVQITALAVIGDQTLAYPVLTDCPVFVASGSTGYLTFPIVAGDTCLILFNDRDIDSWFEAGATTAPNSGRLHDLSDGLVLVGFRHKGNPVPDYSPYDTELRRAKAVVGLDEDSLISIRNEITSLKNILTTLITALNALNTKTGPDSSTQIAAANTLIFQLLK